MWVLIKINCCRGTPSVRSDAMTSDRVPAATYVEMVDERRAYSDGGGGGVKKKRGYARGGSNDRRGGGDRGTLDEGAMRTSGLQLYRGTLSHDDIALDQFDASVAAAMARTSTRPMENKQKTRM
jgi:hypothetical protein